MKHLRFVPFLAIVLALGCGKTELPKPDDDPQIPIPGGQGGGPFAEIAKIKRIPLPTVNLDNLIIPDMRQIQVTNQGPYILIQDTHRLRWSVYKYHGLGSPTWSSFTPDFPVTNFVPTSFTHERDREFSIYWTALDGTRYGMYNLNTGVTSFEYEVPDGGNGTEGPGVFNWVIPGKTSLARSWGITMNDIWFETAVAVPKKFEKIASEVGGEASEYLTQFFADPDDGTTLWCASATRLYEVSSVSASAGGKGGVQRAWDLSSIRSDNFQMVTTITKADGDLVVQFGNKILKQDGNSFRIIGTLSVEGTASSNICSNGSTIFTSDGRYYDRLSGEWKSYLKKGDKLSIEDQFTFDEYQAFLRASLPIGVLQGSAQGPIYFLSPTELIEVYPVFDR